MKTTTKLDEAARIEAELVALRSKDREEVERREKIAQLEQRQAELARGAELASVMSQLAPLEAQYQAELVRADEIFSVFQAELRDLIVGIRHGRKELRQIEALNGQIRHLRAQAQQLGAPAMGGLVQPPYLPQDGQIANYLADRATKVLTALYREEDK